MFSRQSSCLRNSIRFFGPRLVSDERWRDWRQHGTRNCLQYKFILAQKFGSHVKFNSNQLTIETHYIEGPLKDLTTNWKFKEINSNKSKIIFNVNFEFKNFIHQKVAETFYPLIENKMINSFKERADSFLD